MNREALDKWCESGILGLMLAILVFGPLATGAVRTPDLLVIQGLTVGILLLWGLRLWLSPRPQLLWPPICWSVVAFSIYAIVRYLTADIEYVARQEMIRVLIYAFLFLAVVNNLYRQEATERIVFTLVFLAMGISCYAIFQFLTNSDKVWTFIKPYPHRGSGTFISPNHLAGFLEMILPLGLAWTLVSRAKPVMKVFLGYASFVILAGIAVTVSRGGWISVGLALTLFSGILLSIRTYRLPTAALLVVIIGSGIFLIPRSHFFQSRLRGIVANNRLNDSMRFDLWRSAIQLWREDPWWGVGPDHFNQRFPAYRPQSVQLQPDRVHNDYLNTLTDWGIVGTVLVASAWVFLYAGVFKTWRSVRGSPNDFGPRRGNKPALLLGASLGLSAILFHSAVDFNMHIPSNAILAVTLMAMLSSCWRYATEDYWHAVRVPPRISVTLILLAGVSYFGWQGTRRAVEYFWLERARQIPSFSPEQIAALEKAFAVEPKNFETANAVGEAFRVQSWEGGDDYTPLAANAMDWFGRAMKLSPYHSPSFVGYGMCLDWLDRPAEAAPFFDRSVQLDPNNYYTMAHMGWHYVQVEDYAAARVWFERSQRLEPKDNLIASSYRRIVNQRLLENAANRPTLEPVAR